MLSLYLVYINYINVQGPVFTTWWAPCPRTILHGVGRLLTAWGPLIFQKDSRVWAQRMALIGTHLLFVGVFPRRACRAGMSPFQRQLSSMARSSGSVVSHASSHACLEHEYVFAYFEPFLVSSAVPIHECFVTLLV